MSSKPKVKSTPIPDDPDPIPSTPSDLSESVQGAARAERKKSLQSYGRHKTILAGDTSESRKKTILGG